MRFQRCYTPYPLIIEYVASVQMASLVRLFAYEKMLIVPQQTVKVTGTRKQLYIIYQTDNCYIDQQTCMNKGVIVYIVCVQPVKPKLGLNIFATRCHPMVLSKYVQIMFTIKNIFWMYTVYIIFGRTHIFDQMVTITHGFCTASLVSLYI